MPTRIVIFTQDNEASIISDDPSLSVLLVNGDDSGMKTEKIVRVDIETLNQIYDEYADGY